MRNSLLASIILHILIICLFIFGIPFHFNKPDTEYAIVVDMVDISELTNIKASNAKKTKQKQPEPRKNIPIPKAQIEKKVEPIKEKRSTESKEKEPPKQAEAVPEKKKLPEPIKKEEEKKKVEKVKKDKEKKEEDNDIFTKATLKTLEKPSERKKEDKKKPDNDLAEIEKALKGETNKEYKSDLSLSLSEKDFMRSQVEKQWHTSTFSGANSLGMQVTLYVKVDKDGNVLEVKPIKKNPDTSAKYQSFVENAIRTVKKASPLQNLPKEKFKTWEELELTFDSSGMIY